MTIDHETASKYAQWRVTDCERGHSRQPCDDEDCITARAYLDLATQRLERGSEGQWGPVILDEEEWAQFMRNMKNPGQPNERMVAAAETLRAYPRGWQRNELAIMKGLIATGCTDEQLAAGFSAKQSDITRARAALSAPPRDEDKS